jgi:hypothetical protein
MEGQLLLSSQPMTSSIRNPDGIWINTEVFRSEALHFKKYGYYTPELWGTNAWQSYWEDQLKRCRDGYEVGGVRITGHHYFYLNFTNIELVDKDLNILLPEDANMIEESMFADKVTEFPHFWDGDFNYFWALEIARKGIISKNETGTISERRLKGYSDLHLDVHIPENYLDGGHHMIVGKSRRKGYSYKNAAIAANIYNTSRKSITVIGAFEKKYLYPEGTMGMATNYINWLNKYTGWAKAREFVDKQEHRKASFKEDKNGISLESGYQSQILAVTFKDNPDAARGKDAKLVMMEEAGKFPNLRDSFRATEPSLMAGKYVTGQMVIFGTGGDMERDTIDFSYMFYNPLEFNLLPFVNIWDDHAENTNCGFFHPVYMNMEGFYDAQGNSDKKQALDFELSARKKIVEASGSSLSIQGRVQEYPIKPSEAFLTVSFNDFPIEELRNQLNVVIREKLYMKRGQAGTLYRDEENKVRFRPDLKNELEPLYFRTNETPNIRGCVIIYEYPVPNPPHGLYKAGHDPYRQQQAATSTSLGATYIYKGFRQYDFSRDLIVAEYVGRPNTSDDYNRNMEMLAELYNLEIGYENEVTEVRSYFERKKKLHLLAAQPDTVINANIINSKVKRIFGVHMVDKLKDAGEKYIKRWLLRERDFDENGKVILNLHTINSPGLLEELIFYNRKGNFDRVMAFMILMMFIEEEDENKVYDEQPDVTSSEILDFMGKMYRRN